MAERQERGMNERIRRLRRQSVETQPHIDIERAVLETEAYQMYEGKVSVPELRALTLKHIFSHKTLYIGEGELIVGEKGTDPQSAPTLPELCCHTLEDMRNMNDRAVVNFTVTEEDLRIQEEKIIPYWEDRSMRRRILDSMPQEWRDAYGAGIFTEFMEQRGPGHTVGSAKLYEKGYLDYQEDIRAALAKLDYAGADPEVLNRRDQLNAMLIACDAIMILGRRYGELARKLAAVGIESPEQLAEAGAKEAFFRLKKTFPQVCLVHLYALEGAVTGQEYNQLPEETKRELKAFSDYLKNGSV